MSSNFIMRCGVIVFATTLFLITALNAQKAPRANQPTPQNLTCNPAPCILPNVAVSQGGYEKDTNMIAANPVDPLHLLVLAEDYTCVNSRNSLFSSSDGGGTWSHLCAPALPGYFSGAPAVIAYDGSGVAYTAIAESNPVKKADSVMVFSSADNGATWGKPVRVLRDSVPIAMQVDTSPDSPFKDFLYVSSQRFEFTGQTYLYDVAVSHSNDRGKTWTTALIARSNGNIFAVPSTLATARDGSVYLAWTECRFISEFGCFSLRQMVSKSTDGGTTWNPPVTVGIAGILFDYAPLGISPIIAVDNSNQPTQGNVYLAGYDYNGTYSRVSVTTSRDGGATWSAPVPVSKSATGNEYYQWASVSSSGTLGVTWLDSRADGIHNQPYYAISTDGGLTFTGDQPLSDELTSPRVGYFRAHTWIGNALYATWVDTRTGNQQIELGGVQF